MTFLNGPRLAPRLGFAVVLVLALAGCEPEDIGIEPEDPEEPVVEDPEALPEDAVVALPSGVFGVGCQRILEEVRLDPVEDAPGPDDDDLIEEEAGTGPLTDPEAAALAAMSTIEALQAIPELQPVADALVEAGLDEDLEQLVALTLFAPSTRALEEGDAEGDLDLAQVLSGHVHPDAALDAQTLVEQENVVTLAEEELTVTAENEPGVEMTVQLGDVEVGVVCANILTEEGYIHVVDGILRPGGGEDDGPDAE